jgi:hypothetical protein
VSLMNCDYKIVSGCIAARLNATLPGLIHSDQMGLLGHHCSDNLHVIGDTVEYCEQAKIGGAMVFMDQEKYFNRADHEWVYRVLATYGYVEGFIGWVWAFYKGVHSCFLVNGHFTDQVEIGRGLRQGDPPSSLFYVLTSEVTANSVRKDGI